MENTREYLNSIGINLDEIVEGDWDLEVYHKILPPSEETGPEELYVEEKWPDKFQAPLFLTALHRDGDRRFPPLQIQITLEFDAVKGEGVDEDDDYLEYNLRSVSSLNNLPEGIVGNIAEGWHQSDFYRIGVVNAIGHVLDGGSIDAEDIKW